VRIGLLFFQQPLCTLYFLVEFIVLVGKDDLNCVVAFWIEEFCITALPITVGVRAWYILYTYYLTQSIKTGDKSSWFLRKKWLISRRTLIALHVIFTLLAWAAILIVYSVKSKLSNVRNDYGVCVVNTQNFWNLYFYIFAVIMLLIATILLRPVKESYRLKQEAQISVIVWCVGMVLSLVVVEYLNRHPESAVHPQDISEFATTLVLFLIYFITLGSVWRVVRQERLMEENNLRDNPLFEGLNESPIVSILSSPREREKFKSYVALHLCLENMKFMEEVLHWKTYYESGNPEDGARRIYEEFIRPDAPYEINISDAKRVQITKKLNSNEIDPDVFDEAYSAIEGLLVFDTLPGYKAQRGNNDAY